MGATDSMGRSELRRQLFRLMDTRPPGSPAVIRAWPLGFPVVEAVHAVQERIPEPTGLVRRAVLDATCRFGPCSAADLDGLLGIGEDLVVAALCELAAGVPDLTSSNGQYRAGPGARAMLATGEYIRVVEHRRKFLVNGLTGRLLPVAFWRGHDDWRLLPDPSNPEGPFRTTDGRPTEIDGRLSDRAVDGVDDLRRVAGGGDREEKHRLGVPTGSCDVSGEPESCRLNWVTAWVLLHRDGTAEVTSAGSPPVSLLEGPSATADYLRRAVQGLRTGAFDPPSGVPASVTRRWPDAVVRPGECSGEVCVGLPRVDVPPAAGEDRQTHRIEEDLRLGRVWDWHSGAVLTVQPADPRTSAFVAVHRGALELRAAVRPLRPVGPPQWTLADWWDQWLDRFSTALPTDMRPGAIPLPHLLEAAEQLRDGEFLERIEWLTGQ